MNFIALAYRKNSYMFRICFVYVWLLVGLVEKEDVERGVFFVDIPEKPDIPEIPDIPEMADFLRSMSF